MEKILEQLFQNSFVSVPFFDQVVVLLFSILFGLIIGWVYMYAHNSPSYSKSFTISVVLITPLVAAIMLVIGASIIRAFTLLGALALIRFRNAVKEPWDTVVIFWAVVVGMTVGSKLYGFAFMILVVIGVLLVILSKSRFGEKHHKVILSLVADDKQLDFLRKKVDFSIMSSKKEGSSFRYNISVRDSKNIHRFLKNAKISDYSIFENNHY